MRPHAAETEEVYVSQTPGFAISVGRYGGKFYCYLKDIDVWYDFPLPAGNKSASEQCSTFASLLLLS